MNLDAILDFMDEGITFERQPGATPEQLQALLDVSEAIAAHRDLSALLHDLATRLHGVVRFDSVAVILHDSERDVMRLHLLDSSQPTSLPPDVEFPVEESIGGKVWQTQKPFVARELSEAEGFPRVIAFLREQGIGSVCAVPLSTARRRLGAMAFGSLEPHTYDGSEVNFLERVARQVAVAVDNALNFERAQSYQEQLARERDRLRVSLEVTNALASKLELRELFTAIAASLRRLLDCEYVSLALYDAESNQMQLRAVDFPTGKGFFHEKMTVSLDSSPAGRAFLARRPVLVDASQIAQFSPEIARRADAEGLRCGLCLPLFTTRGALGTLNLGSRREACFAQEDVDLLQQVTGQIAIAVENALAYCRIEEMKEKLAEEKLYLEDQIRTEYNADEIIGESPAWRRVLEQARTVAPTNSTVLVLGETGTGKELIARAIHNLSVRRDCTFVKMNCAAIPTGLLESELFGHEKGAFTGALAKRVGRFELANHGTLFLDEIGDIPLELQPKLLRVIQEQAFERLGGTETIRVNVRLVAATNRDLSQMVADGEFRSDLFYRLNIFPIIVPPLRERQEDIPLLIRYFVQKHSRQMDRRIDRIPLAAMEAMQRYSWPGNVRELENFIERAVILSPDRELQPPLAELRQTHEPTVASGVTMEAAERNHILRTLAETNWVIGGPRGAAVRLGMKRTTLQSRMRKLGISRSN